MKRLLLLFTLIMMLAAPAMAQVETPDECAVRIDAEIEVATIDDIRTLYNRVASECLPQDAGTEEEFPRLVLDAWLELPLSECKVGYSELALTSEISYLVGADAPLRIFTRRNSNEDWMPLAYIDRGENIFVYAIAPEGHAIGIELTEAEVKKGTINGEGLHQFEIRTRAGDDRFEVYETWITGYGIGISCR